MKWHVFLPILEVTVGNTKKEIATRAGFPLKVDVQYIVYLTQKHKPHFSLKHIAKEVEIVAM